VTVDPLGPKLCAAVVERQSVVAAGREHIAPSAASRRIAHLARAARVQRCRRHPVGVQL